MKNSPLKKEYRINPKDYNFIVDNWEKLNSTKIDKDILYSSSIIEIFKNSISEIDHRLNWKSERFENFQTEIWQKRFFLFYVLKPIQESKNYKDILKVVYNQHAFSNKVRNSILLMFDFNNIPT